MLRWPARVRCGCWTQMTLKGSRRTAQGASPGKKHTSSHLEKHPGSDPERVEQQRPGREPWRHGRPGCQPGKAEAACTALSGRTSGPATVPRACALGCPAGPLRGPFQFPDPVCFLTGFETICPQCQVCPTVSASRGGFAPQPVSESRSGSMSNCRRYQRRGLQFHTVSEGDCDGVCDPDADTERCPAAGIASCCFRDMPERQTLSGSHGWRPWPQGLRKNDFTFCCSIGSRGMC